MQQLDQKAGRTKALRALELTSLLDISRDECWSIPAYDPTPDDGPAPTAFEASPGNLTLLIGTDGDVFMVPPPTCFKPNLLTAASLRIDVSA